MEFTNDVLEKMKKKLEFNEQVSKWFYKLYLDSSLSNSGKYLNLSKRVSECLTCWNWDVYSKLNLKSEFASFDGLMDLKKVNRCKNRFCSNCRTLDLSRAINNIKDIYSNIISDGAFPYMVTLTVPNCCGSDISTVLTKMQNCFKKFYKLYSSDDSKYMFKSRYIKFIGAIRCVEITYNSKTCMYHPHFHVLAFSYDYYPNLFDKKYKGEWSYKKQTYNMYSEIDIQIRKVWSCLFYNKRLSNIDSLDSILIADIREIKDGGVYEVLKYVFKDTDVKNFHVFKDFYYGLYNKRIRQGYGVFYNCKLENESDGKKQSLFDYVEEIKELPKSLLTADLEALINGYSNYIKISRFNKYDDLDKLE